MMDMMNIRAMFILLLVCVIAQKEYLLGIEAKQQDIKNSTFEEALGCYQEDSFPKYKSIPGVGYNIAIASPLAASDQGVLAQPIFELPEKWVPMKSDSTDKDGCPEWAFRYPDDPHWSWRKKSSFSESSEINTIYSQKSYTEASKSHLDVSENAFLATEDGIGDVDFTSSDDYETTTKSFSTKNSVQERVSRQQTTFKTSVNYSGLKVTDLYLLTLADGYHGQDFTHFFTVYGTHIITDILAGARATLKVTYSESAYSTLSSSSSDLEEGLDGFLLAEMGEATGEANIETDESGESKNEIKKFVQSMSNKKEMQCTGGGSCPESPWDSKQLQDFKTSAFTHSDILKATIHPQYDFITENRWDEFNEYYGKNYGESATPMKETFKTYWKDSLLKFCEGDKCKPKSKTLSSSQHIDFSQQFTYNYGAVPENKWIPLNKMIDSKAGNWLDVVDITMTCDKDHHPIFFEFTLGDHVHAPVTYTSIGGPGQFSCPLNIMIPRTQHIWEICGDNQRSYGGGCACDPGYVLYPPDDYHGDCITCDRMYDMIHQDLKKKKLDLKGGDTITGISAKFDDGKLKRLMFEITSIAEETSKFGCDGGISSDVFPIKLKGAYRLLNYAGTYDLFKGITSIGLRVYKIGGAETVTSWSAIKRSSGTNFNKLDKCARNMFHTSVKAVTGDTNQWGSKSGYEVCDALGFGTCSQLLGPSCDVHACSNAPRANFAVGCYPSNGEKVHAYQISTQGNSVEMTIVVANDLNPQLEVTKGTFNGRWMFLEDNALQFSDREYKLTGIPTELSELRYWQGPCRSNGAEMTLRTTGTAHVLISVGDPYKNDLQIATDDGSMNTPDSITIPDMDTESYSSDHGFLEYTFGPQEEKICCYGEYYYSCTGGCNGDVVTLGQCQQRTSWTLECRECGDVACPKTSCSSNSDCGSKSFCDFEQTSSGSCETCASITDGCSNADFKTQAGENACSEICEGGPGCKCSLHGSQDQEAVGTGGDGPECPCPVAAACTNPDAPDGGTNSRFRYETSTVNEPAECVSQEQVRTCTNGNWGDFTPSEYAYASCSVMAACTNPDAPDGGTNSRFRYETSTVNAPAECVSQEQVRTCTNGEWGPYTPSDYSYETCDVLEECSDPTTPNGGTDSRTRYKDPAVIAPEICDSQLQVRTCSNGNWGEYTPSAYKYENCDQHEFQCEGKRHKISDCEFLVNNWCQKELWTKNNNQQACIDVMTIKDIFQKEENKALEKRITDKVWGHFTEKQPLFWSGFWVGGDDGHWQAIEAEDFIAYVPNIWYIDPMNLQYDSLCTLPSPPDMCGKCDGGCNTAEAKDKFFASFGRICGACCPFNMQTFFDNWSHTFTMAAMANMRKTGEGIKILINNEDVTVFETKTFWKIELPNIVKSAATMYNGHVVWSLTFHDMSEAVFEQNEHAIIQVIKDLPGFEEDDITLSFTGSGGNGVVKVQFAADTYERAEKIITTVKAISQNDLNTKLEEVVDHPHLESVGVPVLEGAYKWKKDEDREAFQQLTLYVNFGLKQDFEDLIKKTYPAESDDKELYPGGTLFTTHVQDCGPKDCPTSADFLKRFFGGPNKDCVLDSAFPDKSKCKSECQLLPQEITQLATGTGTCKPKKDYQCVNGDGDCKGVDCVLDDAASADNCPSSCGKIPGVAQTEAAYGGKPCPEYTCQVGDGQCKQEDDGAQSAVSDPLEERVGGKGFGDVVNVQALLIAQMSAPLAKLAYTWRQIPVKDSKEEEGQVKMVQSVIQDFPNEPTVLSESSKKEHRAYISQGTIPDFEGNSRKAVIVGFPGTESIKDVATDLQAAVRTPWEVNGKSWNVATGFVKRYNAHMNEEDFRDKLWTRVQNYKPEYIYIVGHSLGGAISAICGADLVTDSKYEGYKIVVITFGAPRVFGYLTAPDVNNYFKPGNAGGHESWRFVQYGDTIPSLPTKIIMGFEHVGRPFYLTKTVWIPFATGSGKWEFQEQHQDFTPWTIYHTKFPSHTCTMGGIVLTHSMVEYECRLKKLRQQAVSDKLLDDCESDVKECSGVSAVSRDPANGCEFPACPSPTDVCASDVKECSDGSTVSRDPANGCEFPACPSGCKCSLNRSSYLQEAVGGGGGGGQTCKCELPLSSSITIDGAEATKLKDTGGCATSEELPTPLTGGSSDGVEEAKACAQLCKENAECGFFAYNEDAKTCLLFPSGPRILHDNASSSSSCYQLKRKFQCTGNKRTVKECVDRVNAWCALGVWEKYKEQCTQLMSPEMTISEASAFAGHLWGKLIIKQPLFWSGFVIDGNERNKLSIKRDEFIDAVKNNWYVNPVPSYSYRDPSAEGYDYDAKNFFEKFNEYCGKCCPDTGNAFKENWSNTFTIAATEYMMAKKVEGITMISNNRNIQAFKNEPFWKTELPAIVEAYATWSGDAYKWRDEAANTFKTLTLYVNFGLKPDFEKLIKTKYGELFVLNIKDCGEDCANSIDLLNKFFQKTSGEELAVKATAPVNNNFARLETKTSGEEKIVRAAAPVNDNFARLQHRILGFGGAFALVAFLVFLRSRKQAQEDSFYIALTNLAEEEI